MRYTIRFSQRASDDLTDILGWYQSQGVQGLDKRFIEAMSKTLRRLENNPEGNRLVHLQVRQAMRSLKFSLSLSCTNDVTRLNGKNGYKPPPQYFSTIHHLSFIIHH
jgi:plasmid stabilization system protein ParE